jgi:hypothetical protein
MWVGILAQMVSLSIIFLCVGWSTNLCSCRYSSTTVLCRRCEWSFRDDFSPHLPSRRENLLQYQLWRRPSILSITF